MNKTYKEILSQDKNVWDLFTRREEYSSLRIDEHQRFKFDGRNMEDIKYPLAWELLLNNGFKPEYPAGKTYAVCLTHDVDDIYPPFSHTLVSTFCCARSFNIKELYNQWAWRFTKRSDSPYRNFEKIMNLESRYGAKSTFYFMATDKDIHRFRYNIVDLKNELRIIDQGGWGIGLHTGYYSFDDVNEIKKEKNRIEEIIGRPVIGCRNHYLRFNTPVTWERLAAAGFKYDTTFGYDDIIGFRNGMCGPFKPFNLNSNGEIDIWEIPLNIMDGTLFGPMHLGIVDAKEQVKKMIDTTNKLHGVLTILWHNNIFGWPYRKEWAGLYEWILQYAYEGGAWLASSEEIYLWAMKHAENNMMVT